MKILYQAKRKDNGEWVKGYYIFRKIWKSDLHIIRTEDNGFDSYTEFEVIPETVGQYVNRDDTKGNYLFVGDIVNIYVSNSYVAKDLVIKFDEERCSFVAAGKLSVYPLLSKYNWKKVGNIYDNKED